jgi:hypothetical protein
VLFVFQFCQEFLQCGIGVSHHLKDMKEVALRSKKEIISERVRLYQKELQKTVKPPIQIDAIDNWKKQYLNVQSRYKFLVLHGDSMWGKSVFAVSLFGEEFTMLVDCSGGKVPDLREHDALVVKAIVLDEMSLWQVMEFKRLLQAPPIPVTLGTSSTQMYSYSVWVARVAFIVTSNRFTEDLAALDPVDAAWVTSNCVPYHVTSPMWLA